MEALDTIKSNDVSQKIQIFSQQCEKFSRKGQIINFISQSTLTFFEKFPIPINFLPKDFVTWEDHNGLQIVKKLLNF